MLITAAILKQFGVVESLDGRTRLDKGGGGVILPKASIIKITTANEGDNLSSLCVLNRCRAVTNAHSTRTARFKEGFHLCFELLLNPPIQRRLNGQSAAANDRFAEFTLQLIAHHEHEMRRLDAG